VPDVDIVVSPVGGGGLISGVATAVRQVGKTARVVGVEPAGAAKMSTSLAAGHPVTLEHTQSIADGLMPVRPGDITFAHVSAFVDRVVTVTDDEIARAALWLFYEAKQVVEPSGAASVAAVLNAKEGSPLADRSKRIVAILSGGNVAPDTLAALAKRPASL
jgi:threonine dehydratase